MKNTLDFPAGKPEAYIRLDNEPVFDAKRHLALELPQSVSSKSLFDLGYDETTIEKCPSSVAVTSPFRIFSDEGLAIIQDLTQRMKSNRNEATGTGKNRLGSYIRGAGYRSQFIRDFCESPELLDFLSTIAAVRLARHTVPAVACGINYAPEDITRAIDTWHVDSVAFDIVILLTDPSTFRGGQFQYFNGTKSEGAEILGVSGEGGTQKELPSDRVTSVAFPQAGYGFMQQGNMVFHRACRLLEKADRVTMIPSFVALSDKPDGTNVRQMSQWEDPGLLVELARHEAWFAQGQLHRLIDELPIDASATQIAERIEEAVAGLVRFSSDMRINK